MPTTSLTVLFGKNALTMRTDFSVTAITGGEHTPASSLENENAQNKYITFEPDYWLLDGSYHFMPTGAQGGYISQSQSDGSGNFGTPPLLRFIFAGVHSTDGLTLHFAEKTDDYPTDIDIAFYNAAGSLIRTDNYIPSSWQFATGQAVSNFKRIDITFNSTNNPYRFARLFNIDFDTLTRWGGDHLRNGRLVERVDVLSLELPVNELSFSIISDDPDFAVLNPSGAYAALEENEPIEAYESIEGESVFLGRFYLNEWNSLSENEARFTAFDAIALLEEDTFYTPSSSFSTFGFVADGFIDNILKTRPRRTSSYTSNANSFSTAVTTLSWNHTSVGEDRLLIVHLWLEGSNTMTAATYGGRDLTELTMVTNGDPRLRSFYMVSPPVGTYSISFTWTTSRKCAGAAISYVNVNQTTPIGTQFSNTGTSETSSSLQMTDMTDNALIYDVMFVYNGTNTTIPTFSPSNEDDEFDEIYEVDATWQDGGAGKAARIRTYNKLRNNTMSKSAIANGTNWIHTGFTIFPANPAPAVQYELDASLYDIPLWFSFGSTGMLPAMTRREALQQVCFAIGAYATCARSRTVKIKPFRLAGHDTFPFDHTLDAGNKHISSPVVLRKAVTLLDLASYRYQFATLPSLQTVFSRALDPGIYTITYDLGLNLSDATSTTTHDWIAFGEWWLKIHIFTSGDFILRSDTLQSQISERSIVVNDTVPVGTPANVVSITESLLVSPDRISNLKSDFIHPTIRRIYSYYLQRVMQSTKLFGMNVKAGDSASVASQGQVVYGIIERAEIDLTGGFVAKVDIIGEVERTPKSIKYNNTSTKFTYSGFPNTDLNASHYQGDIRWSPDGQSGYITFYIIGYQFKFIYRQLTGGAEGSVKIFIDGAEIVTIDQNGTTVYQQEWISPPMENTYHTIKIEKVGTTGVVNIDAMEVFYR